MVTHTRFTCSRAIHTALLVTTLILTSYSAQAIEFEQGELSGYFDTTISWGASWRVEDRDPDLIGRYHPNGNAFSANTDDGNLNYGKGIISNALKVTHDLDLKYNNLGAFFRGTYFYDFHNEDKNELSKAAKDKIGKDIDLLDAYISGNFNAGGRNLDIRVGKQVVSWGESTFISNSINTLNPVDVSKFRVPGAELREGLIPTPMVWGALELSDNISIEAVYQTKFVHTEIDPKGAYFNILEGAGDGGNYFVSGFGLTDNNVCPGVPARCIPRNPDRNADDDGQFGIAFRYFSPELNDTEFGFYYINYHSRSPILSAVSDDTAFGAGARSRYFIEYPEDISLLGLSFNTVLGNSGIALQGEYSYRNDAPLQVDDVELLVAALRLDQAGLPASQLGTFGTNEEVSGFRKHDISQFQMTATKAFGARNPFKANQWVLVGEIGATYVHDLPSKSVLRYEGPGTPTPGNATFAASQSVPQETNGHADDFSWGYRLVTRLDYNNSLGPATLSPRLAFAHDVSGTSPGPGGNFLEDRKALTLGLGLNYLDKWTGDLSYTRFWGAGNYNLIHDRDFVALNIKYSF